VSKILVTGGSGFIGTSVCNMLVKEGYEVHNLDRVKKVIPGTKQHWMDLGNTELLDQILCEHQYDAVIHLASEHEVGRSIVEPELYYENNVVNTISLLRLMKKHGIDKLIMSSSSSVYGDADCYPTHEEMPKKPLSPYARTKAIMEDMLQDFDRAYGIQYTALRYFNAVGAGYTQEPATHIMPKLCQKVLSGETFNVYGGDYDTADGTCERDYTHLEDIAEAHILALNYLFNGGTSQILNIGEGYTWSVLEILEKFEEVTGEEVKYEFTDRREGDVMTTSSDSSKAKDLLGWEPSYNIEDMIKDAWEWEKNK
jgi:UDP-glucose 4-epimerase